VSAAGPALGDRLGQVCLNRQRFGATAGAVM
jgi:hypothetical protein